MRSWIVLLAVGCAGAEPSALEAPNRAGLLQGGQDDVIVQGECLEAMAQGLFGQSIDDMMEDEGWVQHGVKKKAPAGTSFTFMGVTWSCQCAQGSSEQCQWQARWDPIFATSGLECTGSCEPAAPGAIPASCKAVRVSGGVSTEPAQTETCGG
ncbi:MAG: hypothetical protein KTR31_32030 [Myxococcales bacterium]|nr:hypothetical protein [Myxococcales bacterium]